MIQWYCEDGNDNWIDIFDKLKDAKEFAKRNEKVLEIHKYNHIKSKDDPIDIEHLGCVWIRLGWNGFEFVD